MNGMLIIKIVLHFLSVGLQTQISSTLPAYGDGSSNWIYTIESLGNHYWLAKNTGRWSVHYHQVEDKDASVTGQGGVCGAISWVPIGISAFKFTDSQNGWHYKITELYANRSNTGYIGLFGYLDAATVSNITLSIVNYTGRDYIVDLAVLIDGIPDLASYTNIADYLDFSGNKYLGVGFTQHWIMGSTTNSGYPFLTWQTKVLNGHNNWFDPNNWNNYSLLPIENEIISINLANENPVVSATGQTAICGDLIMAFGNSRTISHNGRIIVTGANADNLGTVGFVIQSNASLTGSLMHSSLDLPATAQRNISAFDCGNLVNDWHFLSHPALGWFISDFHTHWQENDFYNWNEATHLWINRIILVTYPPVGESCKRCIVQEHSDATQGFDLAFDAYIFSGFTPQFYFDAEDSKFLTIQNFVVESGGNALLIAGQNIVMLHETHLQNGANLHAYITLNNKYCSNGESILAAKDDKSITKPAYML